MELKQDYTMRFDGRKHRLYSSAKVRCGDHCSRRDGRENAMKQVHIFVLGFLLNFVVMLISPENAAAQTAPTFVGVRTFLSAPYEPDLEQLKADSAVLAGPFDDGERGQPGESCGPRARRENAHEYA